MHPIAWYLALLISIPQTLMIILMGFSLFNLKIDLSRTVIVALVMGVICYLIRLLPIPLAVNTICIILGIAVLTSLIGNTPFLDSFIASLLGVMLYGVIENIILQTFFKITEYTVSDVITNSFLNIVLFIPVLLLILSIYFLCRRFNVVIYDLGTRGEYSEQR
ncbi:hypothetical protein [Thermosyntropha sp.]|uniref:hypothetical protein n=1 Tax=Thermosyntropha sp. TaxID=2740820 RepID=UPI0025DA5AA6|nr:hypothetical protein [Thermosyntropha sp.]MBO8158943.1 hypothetical protein [Thermosyntropha sp.]